MSDAELMGAVVAGGDEGFAIFHERFAGVLAGFIRPILWDTAEAADALQDALFQIWKDAGRFDPARGSLNSWAIVIARNKALDRRRRSGRQRRWLETGSEITIEIEPQKVQTPDVSLMRSDEARRVRAALVYLSAGEREALECAFLGDMTHVETALKLGIPLGTVKARIRRGLLSLREIMRTDQPPARSELRSRANAMLKHVDTECLWELAA